MQECDAKAGDMSERRRAVRTNVYKCAKIVSPQFSRDCVVRDISTLGARVAMLSTAYIPDTFDLTFDAARTLRACRLVWRTETQIGIEFAATQFRPATLEATTVG